MSNGAYKEIACANAGCDAVIVAHTDIVNRWRRTHENFYCSRGHSNYFPQETEDEKRIKERDKKIGMLERRVEWRDDQIERMRQAAGSCPWVGCEFHTDHVSWQFSRWERSALWTHMRAAHGMPTLAQVHEADQQSA